MLNKSKTRKALALLVAGAALFQFGGCSNLPRQIFIGFGRSLGAVPSNLVQTLFLNDLINNLIPGANNTPQ